ncbi:DUF202 domain-containing protein [Nocardioides sp. Bht2]|uniref:DUF202 domain-containing protein n=1 Tax=Nocardioides sp. Bht2 TaxID=3392297 RepID=UPI0039B57842
MATFDDPGIANERTALAWQRTALSIVGGAAILARLRAADLAVLAVPLALAAMLGLWVLFESRGRYRRTVRAERRGGRAPAALTLATALIALSELFALLR